jgi:hypothetical protein
MNTHDEVNPQDLYVNPDIIKYKNVANMSDYQKAASRDRKSRTRSVGRSRRPAIIKWLCSWSRIDKLTLAILAATIFAVLITAGVLSL